MSSILDTEMPPEPIPDRELARRSLLGFGEYIALMGGGGGSPGAVLRRPDAVGARIDTAGDNPWFDAVVVPLGVDPPADDPLLPLCVWTMADAVPGRVEDPAIATPCMGVPLDDPVLRALGRGTARVEPAPLAVLGEMNERAYGQAGVFGPLVRAVRDERVRSCGLRDGDEFVCVAATLSMGDDLGIYFVATEESHRRRGLASGLLLALLADARDAGMRTATLQASADGLGVYERLGFRRVGDMRGYLRPAP
jgi:ribosomal protein S18 acetylase RimI-like enzyme